MSATTAKLSNKKAAKKSTASAIPTAGISAHHTNAAAVAEYHSAFRSGTPFPHIYLENVFHEDLLSAVRDELLGGEFFPKRNDLYHFEQSDDLKKATGNATAALRDYIYSPSFREWMQGITGIETNDTIDISCAKYSDTSYLLCHDDDLAARRIAYIIYLNDSEWRGEDGGSLDLLSVSPEDDTVPDAVVRSYTPTWNAMAFFEVSAISHHQVAEVLSEAKGPRLSISGWLHGKPIARPPPPPPPTLKFIAPLTSVPKDSSSATPITNAKLPTGADDALEYWIQPTYLKPNIIKQIRAQFGKAGSIELPQFIIPEKYASIMKCLATQRWSAVGPANMQHFKVCHDTAGPVTAKTGSVPGYPFTMPGVAAVNGILPDIVSRLYNFLISENFAAFVAALTGQSLATVAGRCRCFGQGDYTMITDSEYKGDIKKVKLQKLEELNGPGALPQVSGTKRRREEEVAAPAAQPSLDANVCFVVSEEWPEEHGGYISYLTADEELLSVSPKQNSLSLVARQPTVMSFVKYVNHLAEENRYDFALQYLVEE